MRLLRKISNALSLIEKLAVTALLSLMLLLAFTQVVLRNVFSSGFLWADPLLRHTVLWIGFLGAALAAQGEKHINIDILTRFLSSRNTAIIHILTNSFAGIVCFFLARAGWTFLWSEMFSEGNLFTIGRAEFPTWWFQSIIPVGFTLVSFHFFIKALELLVDAFIRKDRVSGPASTPGAES